MNKHQFIITQNFRLTPTTILLTLSLSHPQLQFQFEPGQYVGISYKEHIFPSPVRCFSIVSTPNPESTLQLGIRLGGAYTHKLASLAPGTQCTIYGPFGEFVLPKQNLGPIILLAGGIGITPLLSILRSATKQQLNHPIHLLYSNRSQTDIPFLPEIKQLASINPHLHYQIHLSEESAPSTLEPNMTLGKIDKTILKELPLEGHFLICGPPPFMTAMVNTLLDLKVNPERIITEAFGQQANPIIPQSDWMPALLYWSVATALVLSTVGVATADLNAKASDATSLPSPSLSPTPLVNPTPTPSLSPSLKPTATPSPSPTPQVYYPRSHAS